MKKMEASNFGFRQFFDKDSGTFTYLIFDSSRFEGIIIDPVKEKFEENLKFIEEIGVKLKYAVDTHVHADHITSSGMLRESTGSKSVFSSMSEVECADVLLKDGEKLIFGNFSIEAILTPGHTNSCMSLYTNGRIFSGDSLLIRSCGRTDFQQGSPDKLFESITKKLYSLPDDTLVYPAHDYLGRTVSSIKEEKLFNSRIFSGQTIEKFVKIMKNLDLPKPKKIDEAVSLNLKCGLSN